MPLKCVSLTAVSINVAEVINIFHFNATYIQISCANEGVIAEISEKFTYDVEGAQHSSLVKNRLWDGKKRLFNRINNTLHFGLLPYLIMFAEQNKYEYVIEDILYNVLAKNADFDSDAYIKSLDIKSIVPYDYQIAAVSSLIKDKRRLCVSPTSSGKSFLMYCIIRWYLTHLNGKILLIVPRVDLIKQLIGEFKEYGDYDIVQHIHMIHEGTAKNGTGRIYVSTWQSIYKMPQKYFSQFVAVMGDEAHETICAESSKGIFDKCTNAYYRVGLTGTIKNAKTTKMVMEGVTGEYLQVTTTRKLMDEGKVSNLSIKCIVLKYNDEVRKKNQKLDYHKEQVFITTYAERNRIIALIADSINDGNVLILTKYLNHADLLLAALSQSKKKIFLITGDTETDERVKNKLATENLDNVIIIATEGVFATGISIKNLQNLINTTGGRSSIRLLQSIGRILRLDGKTNECTLFDIVDDFSWKMKKNHMLRHFFERVTIYSSEGFKFILKNLPIK